MLGLGVQGLRDIGEILNPEHLSWGYICRVILAEAWEKTIKSTQAEAHIVVPSRLRACYPRHEA